MLLAHELAHGPESGPGSVCLKALTTGRKFPLTPSFARSLRKATDVLAQSVV